MMIDLVKMLRNVFLMQATLDKFDIYCVRCFDHKYDWRRTRKHKTASIGNESRESESTTVTSRNVEDGMTRWTYSADVTCSALATTD